MKKILLPTIVVLCFLSACKEEKAPSENVQAESVAPLAVENYTPPVPMPDTPTADGYIDTTRYSNDGVNEYQLGDSLLGAWAGVEGTSLLIERDDGKEYKVTVTNLDGPRTFPGKATKEGISFDRDGKTELIRIGDGIDTGMKYLADKFDCVVINPGSEGFCRDEDQPLDAVTK